MNFVIPLLLILTSIIIYPNLKSWSTLSERDQFNFKLDANICSDFLDKKIVLKYESPSDFVYNLLSVKNVYFAKYKDKNVVIKKMGTLIPPGEEENLVNSLTNFENDFSACNHKTAANFVQQLIIKQYNITLINQLNCEPLLLDILNSNPHFNAVPRLLGYCGKLYVTEYCGETLNAAADLNWLSRAYLALQLMEIARNFTDFRVYLTDISPDNFVFDAGSLKVSFVDLENVILNEKTLISGREVHYSEHFEGESFVFSRGEICKHSLSDHNVYAVCWLLLSQSAPWPMMKGGLLHSPPFEIQSNYAELFKSIEQCVVTYNKISRFDLSDRIIKWLKIILARQDLHDLFN